MPTTPEEWHAWQRELGVPIFTGTMMVNVPLSELVERIAEEKARGRGLIAMSRLPTEPASYEAENVNRVQVRLVLVEPDPSPASVALTAITFTPEDALAAMKQQRFYGKVQTVGPITDMHAALMTLPEVDALVNKGIPPASPGTVPGTLVILAVVRGSFAVHGPPIPGTAHQPISFITAYQVFDARTGFVFRAGASHHDIVMPEWATSSPRAGDQEEQP